MKRMICSLVLILFASPLWAANQTVTLSIPGMNCVTCPITVKKALTKVAGVSKIEISLPRREATVTFDQTKTNTAALTSATKNAGFPSTLVGAAQ